jgi:hypothetical protein
VLFLCRFLYSHVDEETNHVLGSEQVLLVYSIYNLYFIIASQYGFRYLKEQKEGKSYSKNLLLLFSLCLCRYIQCMHQKLYHLTTADYEEFVNIVCSARAAFQITPEGNTQFKEWLQSIRRYGFI